MLALGIVRASGWAWTDARESQLLASLVRVGVAVGKKSYSLLWRSCLSSELQCGESTLAHLNSISAMGNHHQPLLARKTTIRITSPNPIACMQQRKGSRLSTSHVEPTGREMGWTNRRSSIVMTCKAWASTTTQILSNATPSIWFVTNFVFCESGL